MNIHDINPYIRVAMPSRFPPNHQILERIIFDYELIYVEEGSFRFSYGKQTYLCSVGDFVFIRPGIAHSFRSTASGASQPHIHFDLTYMPDSRTVPVSFKNLPDMTAFERKMIRPDAFSDYPREPFVHFSDAPELLRLFYEVIDPRTPLHTLRKKALMTEIINRLIQDNFPACFSDESTQLPPAAQLKAYIDAGQGLHSSLDDYESQFFYSKFYLERQFKQLYGTPIMAYQNKKRMEVARSMLSDRTVTDIAKELGYSSIHAFSRAFKSHFGVSPTEFHSPKSSPGL